MRTIMLLVLLLACVELLKSAPKIITFLPSPPLGCVKLPLESNPIPYPEYLYLSTSVFFVNLTALNRQFCKVGPIPPKIVLGVNLQTTKNVYYRSMIVCNFILL